MTLRLLLVRHGVTEWNREGRFQGHLDPPLADDGRLEAQLLAARLAASDPALRVISSPLDRAAETARIIGRADGTRGVELDPRLMEIGQGEWEGRTHTELASDDAERYAAWRAHAGDQQPPGAETIEAALARVSRFVDELEAAAPVASVARDGGAVCVVSHGGILRLAARRLLGLDGRRAWAMDVDNASLSALERTEDGAWQLQRWNDTTHLLGRTAQHVDEVEGEPLAL